MWFRLSDSYFIVLNFGSERVLLKEIKIRNKKMTNSLYNTDNILCNFPACLRKNIQELCLRSQIGLGFVGLQDISILSNRFHNDESDFSNYHFIIKIPYAGKRLKWEIIFDPEDFFFAPDFDFNDDHFLNEPEYEMIANNVPSLVDWNIQDPKALSQVLNEFLSLYKKLQVEKMSQENIYSRYCEEYQELIAEGSGIKSDNVEVCLDNTYIHFLISLKINCASLPEYIQPSDSDQTIWYNPGEDFAHLKISILKLEGSRSNITLQLSTRLEQVLGNSRNILLPEYKRDITLTEYATKVSQIIADRIEIVVHHFQMKTIYIMNLAAACSHSIVEYDTETFNKAVILYNINDYSCLITVTIGSKFPQDRPSVHLTSIYCQEGKQCNENCGKYPYNPNHQPDINIEALLEYLPEAVLKFKNHKH